MKPTYEQLEAQVLELSVKLANVESKCAELAVENAGLKTGVTYFAFAPEYGFDYFANKQDAIDTAQAEIDAYRDDAFDGWDEDVRRVSWGVVIQQADGFDAEGVHISDRCHTYQTCDYQLVDMVETPATDAYLAEVRAAEAKHVYDSILDNPAVTDMESLVDWLEQNSKDSVSFAAQLRQGAKS
ncbi:hypothetical protein [Kluyvera sichuanensis]|uniref:hypothetical protein n=1 Tax=Kluyvera sichuanensis TaxID=2725494 RepID=UPI0034A23F1A